MIPSFHWAGTSFSPRSCWRGCIACWQLSLCLLWWLLLVSSPALQSSHFSESWWSAWSLPLRVCRSWRAVLSLLMGCLVVSQGRGDSAVPWSVLCPSFQLFLGCCRWVPVLVHHWLVCLLEFARRLLDHQVQVPQIPRGAAVSACLAMLSISSSFHIAQVCNILWNKFLFLIRELFLRPNWGSVAVLFPRWIRDPKNNCSRPNLCFPTGEFSYDRVSYEWSLPWNNLNNSGRQGVRVSYSLVITKPCNPPVDTGHDEENMACCSVTNSYENAWSRISITR